MSMVFEVHTFPVLAISLIPNLLKFLWRATIFPGSPVTCMIIKNLVTESQNLINKYPNARTISSPWHHGDSFALKRPACTKMSTSMVTEWSEISTILALKIFTIHLICKPETITRQIIIINRKNIKTLRKGCDVQRKEVSTSAR